MYRYNIELKLQLVREKMNKVFSLFLIAVAYLSPGCAIALPNCTENRVQDNCKTSFKSFSGKLYRGEIRNGIFKGKRPILGHIMEGRFKNGQPVGTIYFKILNIEMWIDTVGGWSFKKGKIKRRDYTYSGELALFNNVPTPHGKGKLIGPKFSYVGQIKAGKADGVGKNTFKDGSTYHGEFRNDKRHGQGVFTDADGSKKEGFWEKNNFKVAQKTRFSTKSSAQKASSLKSFFINLPKKQRKNLQILLKDSNYYSSSIDGLYGPGTERALKSYNNKRLIGNDLSLGTNIEKLFNTILKTEKSIKPIRETKTTTNTALKAENPSTLEDERYLKAIHVSDDLNKHKMAMISAARKLVDENICSFNDVEEYGGWVKSGQRKGKYFMDCGGTRHWLDPTKSAGIVKSTRHVSESTARDACYDYVIKKIPGANIQVFNNSFTKHIVGSVTFVTGFKVKNAFNKTIKYDAYCLIQSDMSMEVDIQTQ